MLGIPRIFDAALWSSFSVKTGKNNSIFARLFFLARDREVIICHTVIICLGTRPTAVLARELGKFVREPSGMECYDSGFANAVKYLGQSMRMR